jgi:pentatricopeptide repeat protein
MHNTLIGLCKVGNVKESVKSFKQMKDNGNVPDMITYAILMDKLRMEGTPQNANRLLHEILRKV